MKPVLEVTNLSHSFNNEFENHCVLQSINLRVESAELVMLTGPSGCGKTTLLTLIAGLRAVQNGSIRLFEEELYGSNSARRLQLRSRIGMVFQTHHLIGFLTAEENIVLAMDPTIYGHRDMMHKRRRAKELLMQLGLESKIYSFPSQLSGGQRQRVAIARALVCYPGFIIADEPTASLDPENTRIIMELLKQLVSVHELSVLMTTHDARLHQYADRIVEISDGRIVRQV